MGGIDRRRRAGALAGAALPRPRRWFPPPRTCATCGPSPGRPARSGRFGCATPCACPASRARHPHRRDSRRATRRSRTLTMPKLIVTAEGDWLVDPSHGRTLARGGRAAGRRRPPRPARLPPRRRARQGRAAAAAPAARPVVRPERAAVRLSALSFQLEGVGEGPGTKPSVSAPGPEIAAHRIAPCRSDASRHRDRMPFAQRERPGGVRAGARAQARSGIGRISLFDPEGLPATIAGELKDFDPAAHVAAKEQKHVSRAVPMAIAASRRGPRGRGHRRRSASRSKSAGSSACARHRRRPDRVLRADVPPLLHEPGQEGVGLRDPVGHDRDALLRDLDALRPARPVPRRLDGLRLLDRRDRLRLPRDQVRERRHLPHRRRGRDGRARHHGGLRHDAHRLDGLGVRSAARLAAFLGRPRRFRARRGSLDVRPRGGRSRPRAGRADLRRDPRIRRDLRRAPPRAPGRNRRGARARDVAGAGGGGLCPRKPSTTSRTTAPRPP